MSLLSEMTSKDGRCGAATSAGRAEAPRIASATSNAKLGASVTFKFLERAGRRPVPLFAYIEAKNRRKTPLRLQSFPNSGPCVLSATCQKRK
ncbi:MAG: hypothetical protein WBA66_07540 [Xanthobacteraceae bacterium]